MARRARPLAATVPPKTVYRTGSTFGLGLALIVLGLGCQLLPLGVSLDPAPMPTGPAVGWPLAGLTLAGIGWFGLARQCMSVDIAGVTVIKVLRTIRVPWSQIETFTATE